MMNFTGPTARTLGCEKPCGDQGDQNVVAMTARSSNNFTTPINQDQIHDVNRKRTGQDTTTQFSALDLEKQSA
jgi:hypothetical protein